MNDRYHSRDVCVTKHERHSARSNEKIACGSPFIYRDLLYSSCIYTADNEFGRTFPLRARDVSVTLEVPCGFLSSRFPSYIVSSPPHSLSFSPALFTRRRNTTTLSLSHRLEILLPNALFTLCVQFSVRRACTTVVIYTELRCVLEAFGSPGSWKLYNLSSEQMQE